MIAGPCVVEPGDVLPRVAEVLARFAERRRVPVCFKASFDKANRSSLEAPRGPGADEGLRILERVRASSGLPLLTDVHEPGQAAAAAQVADVLQIPAFLCRQTDLLVAAGRTGRPVNVKKGQWMPAEGMAGSLEKVRSGGTREVAVTERGTFFGYGNLVVDMRSFAQLREECAAPAIFDGTHSVQRPGEGAGVSGGDRCPHQRGDEARLAAGADALFLETHPNPSCAPSDATNMLPLDRLRPLLEEVLALRSALGMEASAGAR